MSTRFRHPPLRRPRRLLAKDLPAYVVVQTELPWRSMYEERASLFDFSHLDNSVFVFGELVVATAPRLKTRCKGGGKRDCGVEISGQFL